MWIVNDFLFQPTVGWLAGSFQYSGVMMDSPHRFAFSFHAFSVAVVTSAAHGQLYPALFLCFSLSVFELHKQHSLHFHTRTQTDRLATFLHCNLLSVTTTTAAVGTKLGSICCIAQLFGHLPSKHNTLLQPQQSSHF